MRSVVEAVDVCKTYPLRNSSWATFKQALLKTKVSPPVGFNALSDISFEVFQGETIGVIGPNGAGKSTLFQILAGTLSATSGCTEVHGRLAAVLELGSGFDHNFTGRENLLTYASSMGMKNIEAKAKLDEIIDFSGVGEFADYPLNTYSTGMLSRLAFSAAIMVEPDILILDEVFSVGDQVFARKSFNRVREIMDRGKTVFLSSHSPYHIQMVCNRTLYLSKGRNLFFGATKEALVRYEQDSEELGETVDEANTSDNRDDETENKAEFKNVTIFKNDDPLPTENQLVEFRSKIDSLHLKFEFDFERANDPPKLGVVIHDHLRRPLACAGSHFDGFDYRLPTVDQVAKVLISFPLLPLLKGEYEIDVFLLCEKGFLLLHHLTLSTRLKVVQESKEVGIFTLPHEWKDVSN
ncbi:MAG: hypothetical protein CMI26_11340 [Opitutae bacterium]|nr:hypothetical protein [Opitutae bacterium]